MYKNTDKILIYHLKIEPIYRDSLKCCKWGESLIIIGHE